MSYPNQTRGYALATGNTAMNLPADRRPELGQASHHLIDPIFTEALLRISAYLPEWEVELVNDSETWPDYIANSIPIRNICGVMLKKEGMCKFMSIWISIAIEGLDITLCPDVDVNPFADDGQVSHTR